jgi:mRNA interferase RelE/StbE
MFSVVLSPGAAATFAEADRPLARKLSKCFRYLEQNPRQHSNIKLLTGVLRGYLRYRIGDYRVIYRIDDAARVVSVERIAHRREVYE